MIEIKPISSLNAEITVPGSKYIANRLLIICSLANGISILKNVPENDDINNAIKSLGQFGIKIKKNNDELIINGTKGKLIAPKNEINVGDSGTLLRFIAGFAALANGKTRITGSKRIQQRPISDLLKSLDDLGVKTSSNKGNAPIIIQGGNLTGGKTKINGSISSQFISSLLLISPFAENDVEIAVKGKLVSSEYVDLTINLMEEFGVNVIRKNNSFRIKANQEYKSKTFTIPSDWASANYFLAAAAITNGKVTIDNLNLRQNQPESGFIDLLVRMGCRIRIENNSIELTGSGKLKAVEADMSSMPDSVQTLAVVSLFAEGTTRIKNIENLKFKESDRINDTAKELGKPGADVKAKSNEIIIDNKESKTKKLNSNHAVIDSHNDHRMAMSFAVAGLRTGVKIRNPECINKSFPQFLDKLKEIGAEIKETKNIVLIGYRGAGKTSISKELSKLAGMPAISTDEEIKNKVKMPISEFIEKKGWKSFRQAENEIIKGMENTDGAIIDCGGGVVENSENIEILKKKGIMIFLKAPAKVLENRIKSTKNRPSITGKKSFTDEIEEVLSRRMPLYAKAADFEIETANKKPVEAAKSIIKTIDGLNSDKPKMANTEICAVITADNVKDALSEIKKAGPADLTELRLDFIKNINENDVKNLLKNKTKKMIATCRPARFGGLFKGTEKERLELLKAAIGNGADFVDIEFESCIINGITGNKKNSKTIISHHDFDKTPSLEELNSLYDKIKKLNPDLVKIVTTANSINDNFTIFEFLKNKPNLVSFCMGQKGEISRILAGKFNSKLTYASLGKEKESAPGQATLEEMESLFHVKSINKETSVIGIIGEFAENSMSKHMHNPNFVKNSLNFVYVPFKIAEDELAGFIKNFRKFNFRGAAVTIPHKEIIIRLIDGLDETAEQIGATNTLVKDNGKITGYNTDYYGAVRALNEKTEIKDKRILVIGAGGAARAVIFGLKNEGADITITNRTNEKAKKLADEFKVQFDKFSNMRNLIKKCDVLINTTSVGMSPNINESILDEKDMEKGKIVMDLVYKPANTKLIAMAKKKGCTTITGDRMLIYQAVRQFELWTGINPGFENMERELNKKVGK